MGNHRVARAGPRADGADQYATEAKAPHFQYATEAKAPHFQYATEAKAPHFTGARRLTLQNWPVSTRLIAVIILALLMGLVFGGLQVGSAVDSADEFGRVSQLAILGQQVAGLVQALEDERDQTAGIAPLTETSSLN